MLDWRPFLYGGISSLIAETGTFAIDTTKTRLQIQGDTLGGRSSVNAVRYNGMINAILTITKQEGFSALYNGLSAALLRQFVYGTIKMGTYEEMKRLICPNIQGILTFDYKRKVDDVVNLENKKRQASPKKTEQTLHMNVACAIIAGVTASTIANPTDVLKVRFQANNKHFSNLTLFGAMSQIYKSEGVKGLYRGVSSTGIRAAVVCGVELPIYDITKKHIIRNKILPDSKACHFTASFIAGLAGALASNPIDMTRTRLMNQRNLIDGGKSRIYKNALDCVYRTVKNEGFLALWKGFIPNWMRLGPWNIIYFMSFEQFKLMDKKIRSKSH